MFTEQTENEKTHPAKRLHEVAKKPQSSESRGSDQVLGANDKISLSLLSLLSASVLSATGSYCSSLATHS